MPPLLTTADLNKLHASLLRAKMMGDSNKAAALQAQIDRATAAAAAASLASEAAMLSASVPAGARAGIRTAGIQGPPAPLPPLSAPSSSSAAAAGASRQGDQEQVVEVVPAFDVHGRPLRSLASGVPAVLERDDLRSGSRRGKHQGTTNRMDPSVPGQRTGWLPGDDVSGEPDSGTGVSAATRRETGQSLADMLREERDTGAGDLDRRSLSNVAAGGKRGGKLAAGAFGTSASGVDEGDFGGDDDMVALMSDKRHRLTGQEQQKRDMQRAIAAHKTAQSATAACPFCLDGGLQPRKHLIISLGEHSALMYPPGGQLVPGHMQIAPLGHICAMTDADEEVYDEVNRFKAALHEMWAQGGGGGKGSSKADRPPPVPGQRDVDDNDDDAISVESDGDGAAEPIFLETAMRFGPRRHTVIDVIPLPSSLAQDAPLFFRKAITDAEEWTTNAALIDTAGKGLRRCVPKGFPYFHVSWAGGGFVHPIEDEEEWQPRFGVDIAAGMMGRHPGGFGRGGRGRGRGGRNFGGGLGRGGSSSSSSSSAVLPAAATSFEQERRAILDFLAKWEPFDWTRQLEGGQ